MGPWHFEKAGMEHFQNTYGFARSDVGLHNWRERPFSKWAFENVAELVPSSIIRACGLPADEPKADNSDPAFSQMVRLSDRPETVSSFLRRSHTDQFLVSKAGKPILCWQDSCSRADRPHIVFSISKSFTGILAGLLQNLGELDFQKPVSHYVPQALSGGYGDCALQHLLDMRANVDFSEEYLNEDGDYARYRRATLWNPPLAGRPNETLEDMLLSIAKGPGPHGGPFRYLSPNSDLLGIILQRCTGASYAQIMEDLLWHPMGANSNALITVDQKGTPRSAGGISVTARDLLKLGNLLLDHGAANGVQVIPEAWIHDMRHYGDEAAWENGNFSTFLPGGRYRNKWYLLARPSLAYLAIGIHGQWLFVDPETQIVIVKLSSQALPQDDLLDVQGVAFLKQFSKMAGH